MTEKIHLNKNYERDISLVLEDTWVKAFTQEYEGRYGFKNPYSPTFVLFVDKETVQIWEHKKAMDSFLDWLLEQNKKGPSFIQSIVDEYKPVLAESEEYWKLEATTDRAVLRKYLDLTLRGALLFSLWYYTGTDERTPPEVRSLIMALREKDEFFARNATFIRNCVIALGCKEGLVNFVLPQEFPDIPSNDVLSERARTGLIAIDGKEYFSVPLKEFATKHPEYDFASLNDSVAGITEAKGQVAFKGHVTGRVKVVKNIIQMREVEEGAVLVSPMTTPDFLPAMQKASAFVTDEGGVMCHAAIVARELRKPCITGTKIATQIFKDGDMVEVDADNGVVKILG